MLNNYLDDKNILLEIDKMPIRETFVKLELLNKKEESIGEIQGLLLNGNIAVNGDSAVRRTCNFSFFADKDNDQISKDKLLKTKFKIYIGLKNNLPKSLNIYEPILWFPQGIFVFCGINMSKNASSRVVNITAKDKMCLLNGDVAGVIPDTVVLHEYEVYNELIGNYYYEPIVLYEIIKELVHHYGNEKYSNIHIENIPLKIRQLMQYQGNKPIYMEKDETNIYSGNYSWVKNDNSVEFVAGDPIGYTLTDFIYPGELIAVPGDTITSVLDKIKNVLGNFEYFYDIEGNFIFREIRNHLNNSYQPLEAVANSTTLNEYDYVANFSAEDIIYSFKENPKLISAFANNPDYNNIKNDYVVWGVRTTASGTELPIRYHLAIEAKPKENDIEWRQQLYDYVTGDKNNSDQTIAEMDEDGYDYYYKEMVAEWPKLYDINNNEWKPGVFENPKSLDYFLDFIDTDTSFMGKYSVEEIGRRTYAEVNKNCTTIFNKEIPDVIFVETDEEYQELIQSNEYKYVAKTGSNNNKGLMDYMRVSANNLSCYERIRELLYQHLTLNESITITTLPIYWLEPNRKIEVEDDATGIYGEYIIKSFNIPLTHNGTMSIQATRVLTRI